MLSESPADLHAPPLGQALAAHLLVRGQPARAHLGSGGRQQVEEQRVLVVVLHRTRGRAAGHSLRPEEHQLAMLDLRSHTYKQIDPSLTSGSQSSGF